MDGQMNKWMDGYMVGQMENRWMDRWKIDGWMDG